MDQFLELKQLIDECSYPVFFTGAGISTDSGIPESVLIPAPVKKTG